MGCCQTTGLRNERADRSSKSLSRYASRMKSTKLVGSAQFSLDPEMRAREEFDRADLDKNGFISFEEMRKMLFRLNAHVPKKQLRKLFDEKDTDASGELDAEEFVGMFAAADHRPTMNKVFLEADALLNEAVGAHALWEFFQKSAPMDEESGWSPPSLEECARLIREVMTSNKRASVKLGESQLNYPLFRRMLSDPESNHICSPQRVFQVYQDMEQPLTHYFISSSHNSYLEGAQTNGTSTPLALRRALELGVRVIELDCWDGKGGEPIVTHGHTLCKPTSFKSCIEAVEKYAFVASEFPLILTIENHCTKLCQERMAKILTQVLGDKLFRYHRPGEERERLLRGPDEWLSPMALRRKIVIRDKPKALVVKRLKEQDLKAKRQSTLDEEPGGNSPDSRITLDEMSVTVATSGTPTVPPQQRKSLYKRIVGRGGEGKDSVGGFSEVSESAGVLSVSSSAHYDNIQGTSSSSLKSGGEKKGSVSLRLSSISITVGGPLPPSRRPSVKKKGSVKTENSDKTVESADDAHDAYEDDDEELEDFVDEQVENEGIDLLAQRVEDGRNKFVHAMGGSFNFLGRKAEDIFGTMGVSGRGLKLNEAREGAVATNILTGNNPTPRATDSVVHLLELVYIKNVKLRFKEDKYNVNSTVGSGGAAAAILTTRRASQQAIQARKSFSLDYQSIHFTQPSWKSSSSIGEKKMLRLARPGPPCAALSTYAKSHLIRCYPAGSRVESSNYDPCPAWNCGISIVALNYQTNGKHVWLNQGKFSDNGACGWVLKPKAMLEAKSCGQDLPEEEEEVESEKTYWDLLPSINDPAGDVLEITIISAHYLPKPLHVDEDKADVINPFIEIHVDGFDDDQFEKKTKFVDDNGFNPEFNEKFTIPLYRPDLDIMLLVVKHKGTLFAESFIAQCAFPVKLIRPGYRVVPLRRSDSTPIADAFLFVHVKWNRRALDPNKL